MFRTLLFTTALMLVIATTALAEGKATIYGMVTDGSTPLIGAQINIIGTASYASATTETNEKGVYFFTNLPGDEYIIRAFARPDGMYKPGTANVHVGNGKEREVNFSMERK